MGTSSAPAPCPVKSRAMVSRDRAPLSRGSTVTSAFARIGPSTPRAAQCHGMSIFVISWVVVRSPRPIRRVVVNLVPTPGGSVPSMRTLTTSCCQSGNRVGSVTYEKTSSGGRAISIVDTSADIGLLLILRSPLRLRLQIRRNATGGCDRGRGRPAGGAVRGTPEPPARGGLPDARLVDRGGGRRTGGVAARQPRRHRRGGEPARMADHRGRAGMPGHAALAPV